MNSNLHNFVSVSAANYAVNSTIPVALGCSYVTSVDQLENVGDDDVTMMNVTSEEESMIQRLSERHVAVIIATTSALTLIMLIIVVIIVIRHRRCKSCLSVFFFVFIYLPYTGRKNTVYGRSYILYKYQGANMAQTFTLFA